MEEKKTFAIFFDDMKKDAQKRLIAEQLAHNYDLGCDEVKVLRVNVSKDTYGFNRENPIDSKMLNMIHAETENGCWFLVWNCHEHIFEGVYKD